MSVLSAAELYEILRAERYRLKPPPGLESGAVGVIPGGTGRPVDERRTEAISLRERYRWSPLQIARLLRVDEARVTRWLGWPAETEVTYS